VSVHYTLKNDAGETLDSSGESPLSYLHGAHNIVPGLQRQLTGDVGDVDLGPGTERDYQVFPHVEEVDGRVSGEQILCGRGLGSLYRAVCKADGATAKYSEPQEVTAAAFGGVRGGAWAGVFPGAPRWDA